MYDRILVAVDHSEMSDRAVLAARDLATLSKGEVRVLHVREREIATKGVTVMAETADDANAGVAAAVEVLTQAGVKAQGVVGTTVYGFAAREIVGDAKDFDADVIVMGSRGRGDLAGIVLGSTAHKVIHLTDRPVLVVRLRGRQERPGRSRSGQPLARPATTSGKVPDRIEPTLAMEQTESTEASEPTDPIDKIEPAEPIDSIEPRRADRQDRPLASALATLAVAAGRG
jgi:nucleotide-binding universal stress UspA family protein